MVGLFLVMINSMTTRTRIVSSASATDVLAGLIVPGTGIADIQEI